MLAGSIASSKLLNGAVANLTGVNSGDQTITLTGGVTGSGTGSFTATVITNANLTGPVTSTGNATAIANGAISNAMLANSAVANLSGVNTGDQSSVSGNAGSATTTAITNDTTTNTTMYPTWVTATTGNLDQKVSSTKLTFNPSTATLTTTTFAGALSGNATTVTTNANLTGPITSSGNATAIASQTGTGTKFVVDTSPTLITPLLGTVTSGNISACTSTSMVMVTPILGVPTSGTLTNCTGLPTAGLLCSTTNDSAASTKIGEYLSTSVLAASAVSVSSGTGKTIVTLSLTAGDWDVCATLVTKPASTTTTSRCVAGISQTTNTQPTFGAENNVHVYHSAVAATQDIALPVGQTRISLSGTTNIFLVATVTFAVSTMSAYGFIGARRVR